MSPNCHFRQPARALRVGIAGVWIALVLLAWTEWAQAVMLSDVRVEPIGEMGVNAGQVLSMVRMRPGAELDRGVLSEDIRRLKECGHFSYVESRLESRADGSGVDLVLRVQGRPIIRELTIEGAEHFSNKKIRKLLDIGSGDRVDGATLGERAIAVRNEYRDDYYPNARLRWALTPVEGDPTHVDVKIEVDEGERMFVRKIKFEGLHAVKPRALRKLMTQKQSSWLSIFNNDGEYLPAALLADRDVIRKALMDAGHLGAEVGAPTYVRVNEKKIDVTFVIDEGPLYTLDDWRITGMTTFAPSEVEGGIVARRGESASLEAIQQSAQNISDFYGTRGYIRTTADPRIALDATNGTARVTYAVKEGTLAYISDIDIRGNSITKDKVIRREILVAPGGVYDEPRVKRSENRLRNMGYFSFVHAYPEATAVSNQYRLVYELEEKPTTASIMFGVAFSSVDHLMGLVTFNQGNFDLFGWRNHFRGGGQKLQASVQAGSRRKDVDVSWVEPYFLDKRLSFGLGGFWRDIGYYSSEYDQRNIGGRTTFGLPLTSFDRLNLTYCLEQIEIYDVSTNASAWVFDEAGKRMKSSATLELVRDTRDRQFLATRGFRASVAGSLAGGPLGAETDHYGFSAAYSQYVPLWFGHVFNLRGGARMVKEFGDSETVPIFDRMFLGGPMSVRAIKNRKLGPRDEENDARGGRSSANVTAEYTFPIFPIVRGCFFYDGGIVWQGLFAEEVNEKVPVIGDGEWGDGAGLGLRLDIPGFPFQLDYAWPIHHDEGLPDTGRFSFNIGYNF